GGGQPQRPACVLERDPHGGQLLGVERLLHQYCAARHGHVSVRSRHSPAAYGTTVLDFRRSAAGLAGSKLLVPPALTPASAGRGPVMRRRSLGIRERPRGPIPAASRPSARRRARRHAPACRAVRIAGAVGAEMATIAGKRTAIAFCTISNEHRLVTRQNPRLVSTLARGGSCADV